MSTMTRTQLLDAATSVVRRRGYAAFSYADLAEAVGIRKPSVHHHFPTKADLALEMVSRYSGDFMARLRSAQQGSVEQRSAGQGGPGAVRLLEFYAGLYREGLEDGQACLCATLAAEAEAVPEEARRAVARFFAANVDWLTGLVAQGIASGELAAIPDPGQAARGFLSAVQGAMFTARALGDVSYFDGVAASAVEGLRPRAAH
ncbi:TetR/AcrR family transcriptional regulator [Streptomyces sp. NBC_01317]|uniref:TetR/AcrR family transcriptional regulator n=1 Tax=Streptomyces sp. NBC_01317 TaxID=2903822 RepID=UPI002E1544A3|nr:TetR/AcrR family transcriptional regulator [Streptomyces sp. NBC_01317]